MARADERGMTITDYVSAVLAEHVGMPEYATLAPVQSDQGRDQELPMTG